MPIVGLAEGPCGPCVERKVDCIVEVQVGSGGQLRVIRKYVHNLRAVMKLIAGAFLVSGLA